MFKKIWDWFMYSSVDPEKISLTAQGLIMAWVPVIAFVAPFLHLHILPGQLQSLAEMLRDVVVILGTLAATLVTTFGLFRKISNLLRDIYKGLKG